MRPHLPHFPTRRSSDLLHLPLGTAQKFSAEIADIPADKWVSWRRHRVENGETLTSIAKKYRVTAAAIADADRKSTRLNSSHRCISYAVFCLKKKTKIEN